METPSLALSPRQLLWLRITTLIFVIAISIYVFSIRERAQELALYGYPGIFLLSILANSTVLLPAPGVLFVFAMGAVFNPFWVALAAGCGAAIGELSGYLAGFSGQAVIERADLYHRLHTWMKQHTVWSYGMVLLLAFIPNPLFDLAGMAAGALKMPLGKFLFFCLIGKILKMLLFAFAGASSIGQFTSP